MTTTVRSGLCALLLLLITACAGNPPERASLPEPESTSQETLPEQIRPSLEELREARTQSLNAMADWQVKGKVAWRLPDDAGSANLDWQQSGDQTKLRLAGPLGVGSTQISNDGALLRVRRDGIDRLYPADGAPWLPGGALLPIPVASIKYWLRGLPDPKLPVERIEQEAVTPLFLQQAGWQISYAEYREEGGVELPRRLTLVAPSAELNLRIVLRAWSRDSN